MSRGRRPLLRPAVLRSSQAGALSRILPLLAGALLVQPGTAGANPWGIRDDQGAAQRPAPGPDWIQGTAAPAAADRDWSSGDAVGASDGSLPGWPDTGSAPASNSDWGRGVAAGEPPGPAYRFRPDTGDADLPVQPQGAGALRSVDTPAIPTAGYRFRGDPPGSVGPGAGSPDPGSYRFRPLTEREEERRGAGAQPRQRPRRPPPPPDAPTEDGSGRWPSW
ncbi:hypothetical protein [uncultured Thiodictyon sp.]|uniref:hypothetical protein n=1 Tax=uncultured Thiodictyon sp. TaxID=1846217 RepID=UPI0025FBFD7C|nr:hypothetical protein [uncultured Thiodictyon sp.]